MSSSLLAVVVDSMREGDVSAVAAIDGTPAFDERELRAELARPGSRLWVARESGPHGEPAASSPPTAFAIAWHVADELHVLNLATRADRRRRGLARAVMDRVLAYASESAIHRVLLEVRRSNAPAIALYRSLGFFAVGVRARYYPDDEDAVEMALTIDPLTRAIDRRPDDVPLDD
jgi:ribosomal-protein-alanine N-acetyltransferase